MKALILAAGYGTRLYPLTINQPKPLLLVNNRPMINYLLDKISKIDGLKEIFVVTNDKFFALFKEWSKKAQGSFKNLRIKIINDGSQSPDDRKGAIGDIQFVIAEENIQEDLLVLGGDNLFNFGIADFIKFAGGHAPKVSVGLFDIVHKSEAVKFGVAELGEDLKLLSFIEKPKQPLSTLIAMCLYYFPKETLGQMQAYLNSQEKKDTSGDYIDWLYRRQPVYGFVFKGDWFDIGQLDSYSKANQTFGNYAREVKE
ncbi:MAG: nucleotidyltransferase family protein [Candidatus Omnitrophota bacterium]|nr:nucleotidyltransferase family protein [Candidatus Omnitrophota bacterium]